MLFGIPIWVFFCIVFIFISGYMALRAMRAEHHLEQQHIEQEGQVYLTRMEEEKRKTQSTQKSDDVSESYKKVPDVYNGVPQ